MVYTVYLEGFFKEAVGVGLRVNELTQERRRRRSSGGNREGGDRERGGGVCLLGCLFISGCQL